MSLPNFLIIGAQKAGTTWLGRNLQQHPQIFLAGSEVHFFDREKNFNQGIHWYEKHFVEGENSIAIGEKTPEYIYQTNKHEIIQKYLPNIKSILVLKNPVTRALSHLNHLVRQGFVPPSKDYDKIIFDPKTTILDRGFYYQQLMSYFKYFNPEKVLILINEEDIEVDPNLALEKTCNFLGVDSNFEFANTKERIHKHNQSQLGMSLAYYMPSFVRPSIMKIDSRLCKNPYKVSVSQKTIERLYNTYEEENKNLFNLINRQVDAWSMPENAKIA